MKGKLYLTHRDIARLCDGFEGPMPEDLSQRLALQTREFPGAIEIVRDFESVAERAGLAPKSQDRLDAAWNLREDLIFLLGAGEEADPCEVLDPHGSRSIDWRRLLALAESRSRDADPPEGLAGVVETLRRAVADLEQDEKLAESWVAQLLERSKHRASRLLGLAARLYRRRQGASP